MVLQWRWHIAEIYDYLHSVVRLVFSITFFSISLFFCVVINWLSHWHSSKVFKRSHICTMDTHKAHKMLQQFAICLHFTVKISQFRRVALIIVITLIIAGIGCSSANSNYVFRRWLFTLHIKNVLSSFMIWNRFVTVHERLSACGWYSVSLQFYELKLFEWCVLICRCLCTRYAPKIFAVVYQQLI